MWSKKAVGVKADTNPCTPNPIILHFGKCSILGPRILGLGDSWPKDFECRDLELKDFGPRGLGAGDVPVKAIVELKALFLSISIYNLSYNIDRK